MNFSEVGGVRWCIAHQGIVDECGEYRAGHCDMAGTCQHCHGGGTIETDDDSDEPDCPACGGTGREGCDIRTLFVEGDRA